MIHQRQRETRTIYRLGLGERRSELSRAVNILNQAKYSSLDSKGLNKSPTNTRKKTPYRSRDRIKAEKNVKVGRRLCEGAFFDAPTSCRRLAVLPRPSCTKRRRRGGQDEVPAHRSQAGKGTCASRHWWETRGRRAEGSVAGRRPRSPGSLAGN